MCCSAICSSRLKIPLWILQSLEFSPVPIPVPYQDFGAEVQEHFNPRAGWNSSGGFWMAVVAGAAAVARRWHVRTLEHVLAGMMSASILFLQFFIQTLAIIMSVMVGNLFLSEERCLKRSVELSEELNLQSSLLGFFCNSQDLVIYSSILISTQAPISATGIDVSSFC